MSVCEVPASSAVIIGNYSYFAAHKQQQDRSHSPVVVIDFIYLLYINSRRQRLLFQQKIKAVVIVLFC